MIALASRYNKIREVANTRAVMPSWRLCPSAALVAALLASLISAFVATALASAASAHVRSAPLPSSRLRQVLVVADDADGLESTHGGLLRALRAAGGQLKLASTRSAAAGLRGKGGRYLYDAVVLLAPSADALSSALDADAVAAFVDAGGDALLTIEPSSGRALREMAYELGVDCGAPGAALRDHVNYNAAAEGKQVAGEEELELEILSDEVMREAWVVGEGVARESLWAPVACRGCVPLYVDERSELGARVLLAPPSAYAAAPAPSRGARAPASEPARHALVAMLQARNGARAVVAGGAHMLSDTAFEAAVALPGGGASHAKSGNEQLAAELIAWLMHARGHLRASPLRHSRPGESASPDAYRVGEEMVSAWVMLPCRAAPLLAHSSSKVRFFHLPRTPSKAWAAGPCAPVPPRLKMRCQSRPLG